MKAWTREAIENLGPVTDVPTMASILLVNKDTAYTQIRRGEWELTRVLRIGRKIKIPTRDLIALLYAPETVTAPSNSESEQQCASAPHNRSSDAMASHVECGCTLPSPGAVHRLRRA
ncbi:DNA-binding protein [Streptomyces sp. NPDC004237]|uniref:DNA-binding protein n=1 Tax=Streptomyces sp. NPDC004237 TaxID=3154455 RepID=UPI0033BC1032